MDAQQFYNFVLQPTLKQMGKQYATKSSQVLMLVTAQHESHCGHYIQQVGGGPAVGPYQTEPDSIADLHANLLAFKDKLASLVARFRAQEVPEAEDVQTNLKYATAVARMMYYRHEEKLPKFDDFDGMWSYYKRYWNGGRLVDGKLVGGGKATRAQFLAAWNASVAKVEFSGFLGPLRQDQ